MIKLVISLFQGKWKLTFISFLMLIVLSLDGIVLPYFLGKFTDVMTNQEYSQIPLLLFIWFILWLLIVAAQLSNAYFFGKLRSRINIDLKDKMFKKSYEAGNSKVPTSQYISTITSDIKQIEQDFINNTMNFVYSILQGGITLVFLLFINWKVGIIFVLLGTLPTFIPKLTSRWLQKGTENWQEANQQYIGQLEDGLNARNLVKRYGAQNFIFKQLLAGVTTEQNKYFSMNFKRSTSAFYVGALYVVSAMGSLSYGAWSVINGEISAGMLITIYMAADRVVTPLISLANIYNAMTASEPLLRKVLNEEPNHIQPTKPIFTTSNDYLISLENVNIGFKEDKPILESINLRVEQGDRILIEGASGSGKSTLLKTIMNEQDVLSGEIQYGSNLKGNLTEAFAVVEQQPFVFRNTLKYNLMIGQEIADEKLYEVLHKVGLNRMANEEGLQIQLGSETHQLSGGELKRLEVARAILSNKVILVVDEALSGLDGESADQLNQLITSYPGTVMNIEHRVEEKIRERFNKTLKL